jgi:hypothetical protein
MWSSSSSVMSTRVMMIMVKAWLVKGAGPDPRQQKRPVEFSTGRLVSLR